MLRAPLRISSSQDPAPAPWQDPYLCSQLSRGGSDLLPGREAETWGQAQTHCSPAVPPVKTTGRCQEVTP